VVVDQLELAAAAGGAERGLLGGGDAAAVWVAGAGGGGSEDEEPLKDPNQRVRRLPPVLLDCDSAPSTDVVQDPEAAGGLLEAAGGDGALLAVRVGGEDGCATGAAGSLRLRPKPGIQLLHDDDDVLA